MKHQQKIGRAIREIPQDDEVSIKDLAGDLYVSPVRLPKCPWHPIENAPKDGTLFDVFWRDSAGKTGRAVNCEYDDSLGIICKHGYPQVTSMLLNAVYYMIVPAPIEPTIGEVS